MKTSDLGTALGYQPVQQDYTDREISSGYTSDLLSDVMANAAENCVLVTIQAHKNTIAVSSMAGISAIVICNSRPLPEDMIQAAAGEQIALFLTEKNQFTVSGEIYNRLKTE